MGDITMVLVILTFFFACIGYVTWCGRIIGPDPDELDADLDAESAVANDSMRDREISDVTAVRA